MNELEKYNAIAAQESKKGLRQYLDYLVVDSRPPARLRKLLAANPWQKTLYDLLVPAFECAGGYGTTPIRNIFVTAPRGHSKTSTIAQLTSWILCYSKRYSKVYCAAADKDQAKILIERIRLEALHNEWLSTQLNVKHYSVNGPTGHLEVLSSDAPTSSGLLADLYICDELSYHKDRSLFDMLYSGKDKRSTAVFVIISNAGIIGEWQHDLWLQAQSNPAWITHEVPAMSASWLNKESLEEQKIILPPAQYKRLHLNQWSNASDENGFLTREQVKACITGRQSFGNQDNDHIVSIDYGMTKDRTALAVMHQSEEGLYILDKMEVWQGTKESKIPIERIENWLKDVVRDFRIGTIALDAWQLESLAQKYEKIIPLERVTTGGNTLTKLSEHLRSIVLNKQLVLYPGAGALTLSNGRVEDLLDELTALVITEKGQSGWRFDHTEHGHNDRATVLSIGAYYLAKGRSIKPQVFVIDPNENEPTLNPDMINWPGEDTWKPFGQRW